MAVVLFFVIVILFLVFRGNKNNKKSVRPKPNPFKQSPSKSIIQKPAAPRPVMNRTAPAPRPAVIPPQAPPAPNPVQLALDMAAKHFGWEWEDYLKTKPALQINTPAIQRNFAGAYQSLPQMEMRDFLYSMINTQTMLQYDTAGKLIPRKPYLYTDLHQATYDLISQLRLNDRAIQEMIKGLVKNYRDKRQAEKNISAVQVVTIPEVALETKAPESVPVNVSEIINSVAVAKIVPPVQLPAEVSKTSNVIDVVPGDVKLNLGISIGFTPTNFTSSTNPVYQGYNPDDYKLGSKYKTKLNLTPQEALWLNKFMHYTNAFNGIEGCSIAVINLYLATIKKMVRRFANEPVGLQQRLEDIKNAAYKFSLNQPNQWGYYDHSQVKEATEADLYYTVYKKAESAVREAWESGRSISPAFNARSPEALELFKRYTEPVLNEVILELIPSISAPDEITEIELNQKNSTRWKHQFERIVGSSSRDAKTIVKEIHQLAKLNKKNPSVENIYYEAAKFMVPLDKIEALGMYLYYIKFDQKSTRIDNKPFNKTNQKQLFKTPEQQAEFQTIVEELIVLKDIKQSLKKVGVFYEPKRKRITLDSSAIELVGQELSSTVSVLNKYLKEDDELESIIHEKSTPVTSIAAPTNTMVVTALNVLQQALLNLFQTNNFTLSAEAVNNFAQQHGAFKNQLIESINEAGIDVLDDVLIEESEDEYTIDPDYFRKIHPE